MAYYYDDSYKVIEGNNSSRWGGRKQFEAEVNRYLADGYQLVGGMSVTQAMNNNTAGDIKYFQAVAKPKGLYA